MDETPEAPQAPAPQVDCPICAKPPALCVCDSVVKLDNRVELLVLQHPQEQDKTLGTARLLVHHLSRAQMKVGLSWPSLAKALGRMADPRRWAVLYLGSANALELAPGRPVVALSAQGALLPDQDGALAGIEGVVVLDGTWSQAKALWWRNPWVLKCRRLILGPARPSRYGRVRTEPRADSLSTIEAAGLLLARLEGRPEIEAELDASFQRMLDAYKAAKTRQPKPDLRRRWTPKGHPARNRKPRA